MNQTKSKQGRWQRMTGWMRGRQVEPQQSEEEKLREEISQAQADWALAQRHIDYVSDPELIDHAIYYLEAAERKYGYLLREAKKRHALSMETARS